jgi:hypothetical protein
MWRGLGVLRNNTEKPIAFPCRKIGTAMVRRSTKTRQDRTCVVRHDRAVGDPVFMLQCNELPRVDRQRSLPETLIPGAPGKMAN